jgi:hypothetical protein
MPATSAGMTKRGQSAQITTVGAMNIYITSAL